MSKKNETKKKLPVRERRMVYTFLRTDLIEEVDILSIKTKIPRQELIDIAMGSFIGRISKGKITIDEIKKVRSKYELIPQVRRQAKK